MVIRFPGRRRVGPVTKEAVFFQPPAASIGEHSKDETMTAGEPLVTRIATPVREDMSLPWLVTTVGVAWQLPLSDERVWEGCGEGGPGG